MWFEIGCWFGRVQQADSLTGFNASVPGGGALCQWMAAGRSEVLGMAPTGCVGDVAAC